MELNTIDLLINSPDEGLIKFPDEGSVYDTIQDMKFTGNRNNDRYLAYLGYFYMKYPDIAYSRYVVGKETLRDKLHESGIHEADLLLSMNDDHIRFVDSNFYQNLCAIERIHNLPDNLPKYGIITFLLFGLAQLNEFTIRSKRIIEKSLQINSNLSVSKYIDKLLYHFGVIKKINQTSYEIFSNIVSYLYLFWTREIVTYASYAESSQLLLSE